MLNQLAHLVSLDGGVVVSHYTSHTTNQFIERKEKQDKILERENADSYNSTTKSLYIESHNEIEQSML